MLKSRFQMLHFIRTSHFQNQFTSSSNSSHKLQLLISIRMEQADRTADFITSLQFTQIELASGFYTVSKLWMSSFKCHKWNLILTLYKVICSIKDTLFRLSDDHFQVPFNFENPNFTQPNDMIFRRHLTHTIYHIYTPVSQSIEHSSSRFLSFFFLF